MIKLFFTFPSNKWENIMLMHKCFQKYIRDRPCYLYITRGSDVPKASLKSSTNPSYIAYSFSKMQNQTTQAPPPGYPMENCPAYKKKMKCWSQTKAKGDKGFIEGCLFALCCCWMCEVCF